MIASYVNDNYETWDQFLREFKYAIRTAVNETTEKTPAELFLGRKLITPFKKLVMVLDGTEFAVGDIEKLFEARRTTKAKHEKWAKYYNKRRRDVQIKVNDWVLLQTHPLSLTVKKIAAKLKPKFEDPYRVLDVHNNDLVVWKSGKRLTVNIDQVRLYHQRESDENGISVGNSDSSGSRYQASSFEGVRPRSIWSQNSKNSGSSERREVKGKVTGLKEDQGEGRTKVTNRRRPLEGSSNEALIQGYRKLKKSRKEVIGYKRSMNSRLGGRERERKREKSGERKRQGQNKIHVGTIYGPGEQTELSSDHPENRLKTKGHQSCPEEEDIRPYYKEQGGKQQSASQSHQETKSGRSSCQNSRSRGAPQQQRQEIGVIGSHRRRRQQ
ncbi:uncharacterized protein TNCV_3350071 [Trichonephila clavipes]|nr:uncharacterized protein TNCV_3350071 [Trichonephila clavipes]